MPDLKRTLPSWLDGFLHYTSNVETSDLYRKWVGIMCIAAALQRKVKVEWGVSLTFYPNLYIILVGKSATGKGTAMRPALDIISKVPAIKLSSDATSLQALISSLKKNNLTDHDPSTGLTQFHSSMTVYSEEFTVFLGYKNSELIATLCNWYDCQDRWSYDTIKRAKEEVIGVWVNLIGGTTPDLIRSSLPPDSIGGGLTSRIIFVYAEGADRIVTIPTESQEERDLFKQLVLDLEKISMLSGSFQWSKGFIDLWDEWRRNDATNPPFHDTKFDGYCGRRKVHLMKLAMIMSASSGKHDLVLTKDDLISAIEILNEVEQPMAMTFKGVGKSDIADLMFRANMFFKTCHEDEVPYSKFAKFFEGDADKMVLDRLLATMEAMNTAKVIKRVGAESIIKLIK